MHLPSTTLPPNAQVTSAGSPQIGRRRRRLQTFGIFRPKVCLRPRFENHFHRVVYHALLNIGFKRTLWQYIFDGQIAGLVKPGKNDIHIRFYPDRLFAEVEISRAFISHFYGPSYNASRVIEAMLKGRITELEHQWLKNTLDSEALRSEEAALEICAADLSAPAMPFEYVCFSKSRSMRDRIKRRLASVDWRFLGLGTIVFAGLLLRSSFSPTFLLALLITSTAILYAAAPRTPR